jgi:hypothetical protein
MLYLHMNWPGSPKDAARLALLAQHWTAQDRTLLEDRFRRSCPDGFHWPV